MRPVAPALAVCVCSTSARTAAHDAPKLAHRGEVGAGRELPLECRQIDDRNAEVVREVLHRVLTRGQRPSDDGHPMAVGPADARRAR